MSESFSPIKGRLVLAVLLLLSILAAFGMAEIFLRYRADSINSSNDLEKGLVSYDRLLGWKLTPGWKGNHKHYDFQVTYSINAYGFRGDHTAIRRGCKNVQAVIGDSFTFGIGVNNGQTFVDLLNNGSSRECYLNFSVPGYSTDQEYLLIRERVVTYAPKTVLLVVYLGNDIFDNALAYPLQSIHAKPYFKNGSNGLSLHNSPVPRQTKPKKQARKDLQFFTFNHVDHQSGIIAWAARHFQLARALGIERLQATLPDTRPSITSVFNKELNLFKTIIKETDTLCRSRKIELRLVLLPGRSYVERPGSISQQVQGFLGQAIMSYAKSQSIPTIHIADSMQQLYNRSQHNWFYKNEGHLTPEGHRLVAGMIQQWSSDNKR